MESITLLDWLVKKYPLAKRQTFKRMIEAHRVRINGRRANKLSIPLSPEDKVQVLDTRPARGTPRAPAAPALPGIVFEDADILVVDKPAGLLTSTVPKEPRPTLLAQVREYLAAREPVARVGLIHRLDRDASGLLVFSKNNDAFHDLKSQLLRRTVQREYRAIVLGTPSPDRGKIDNRLIERADGTVRSTRKHAHGQRAITEYELLTSDGKLSLLRVLLQTGRKHQIRVQLSERGIPLLGDTMYGPPDAVAAPRLMLAATHLSFRHPRTGAEMTFTVPVPPEFPLHAGAEPRIRTKPVSAQKSLPTSGE